MFLKINRLYAGANTDTIWFYNPSTDMWVWKDYVTNYCFMSTVLGVRITATLDIGTFTLTPYMYTYNSQIWYQTTNKYLWYDSINSIWCITNILGGRNAEYQDSNLAWQGDTWWSCASRTGTFVPRGYQKDTRDSGTVEYAVVNGWRGANLYGSYAASGTGTGTKRVGWEYLTAGAEPTFYEDARTDYVIFENANKTRYLWKYGGKWTISPVLFTVNLSTGYWQTDGAINSTYTKYFTPSGSPPSTLLPETYTLATPQYVENYKATGAIKTQSQYISQVALWL